MLKLFFSIGVIGIIISGILMEAWADGHRQRAIFHSETDNYKKIRTKIAMISGLVGFTSLGIAGLLYFL